MHANAATNVLKSRTRCITLACAWVLALFASAAGAESSIAADAKPPVVKKSRAAKPTEAAQAPAAQELSRPAGPQSAKPPKETTEAAEPRAAVREPASAPNPRATKERRVLQDPLDMLRERLAQRLGATKTTDGQALRVAAHSPTPSAASQAAKDSTAAGSAKKRVAKAQPPRPAGPWAYEGDSGPQNWGRLKPEFSKCSSGERQSPIDIRDGMKLQLDPVQIEYRPSNFRVIDNGHTVQVNVAGGNSIEVMGRRYSLVQFHFHRPSEERIDGRQFDMVAHLVHKDMDGRLAVIAVLLDQGSAHPIVQTVWNNLPLEKGEEVAARATLDLNALLPAERSYFTYMGSMTTPPCNEGVLWMVMKQPVEISGDQIRIFARLYPMNARPVQSAAGRLIKESN